MAEQNRPVAVITGASSGIGAATARALARLGYRPALGARRIERLREAAAETEGLAYELDVTDRASIERFAQRVAAEAGRADVLVNNAGLALGVEPIGESRDEDWVQMYETNVLGLVRVTRAFLPLLRRAPLGHIVNIGSVAGFDVYKGGAGYTSTKHAVRAINNTLRLELNGEPIRVTEVAPGMTSTEFSLVRQKGDEQKADATYEGLIPLSADDIADCVAFAVSRPAYVNIDYLVVRPLAQATSYLVARNNLLADGQKASEAEQPRPGG